MRGAPSKGCGKVSMVPAIVWCAGWSAGESLHLSSRRKREGGRL